MGGLVRGITNAIGLTSEPQEIRTPSVAEQVQGSKDAAVWNAGLNRIAQSTPFSNTNYVYEGTDAQGVPQYRQVTTFTQAGQQQYQNLLQAQAYAKQMLPTVSEASQRLMSAGLGNQVVTDYGAASTSQAAYDQYLTRGTEEINKYFDKQRSMYEQKLFNQGISANSDAYRTALQDFEKGRAEAVSSMAYSALQSADSRAMQAAAFKNQALAQQQSMAQSGISTAQSLYTTLYGAGNASLNTAAPSYAMIQGVDYGSIVGRDMLSQQYNANAAWQSNLQFNNLMGGVAKGIAGSYGYGQGATTGTAAGVKPKGIE